MEAYVHVQARGQKVGVGVVIRDGYETLSAAGWLSGGSDIWQALRDAVAGLCADDVPMVIYTPLQGAELATRVPLERAQPQWRETIRMLTRAGSRISWCGHVHSTTGAKDAQAKALLFLGVERRGEMSWRTQGWRK